MSSLTRYQENDTFLADIFSPLVGVDQLLEVAGKKNLIRGTILLPNTPNL